MSIYIDNVSPVLSSPITLSAMNYLMRPPCCRSCISTGLGRHNVSRFRSPSPPFFPFTFEEAVNPDPEVRLENRPKVGMKPGVYATIETHTELEASDI